MTVNRSSVAQQIKQARRVSTPLIAVTTADQGATARAIVGSFNGGAAPPVVQWDCVRGLTAMNKPAVDGLVDKGIEPGELVHPVEALTMASQVAPRTLVVMHNAQDWLTDPGVRQVVANLRDVMKGQGQTLVMLAPSVELPESLQHDVMVIDEPLPDAEAIGGIVDEIVAAAKTAKADVQEPKGLVREVSVQNLLGLSAFEVEQATALSLDQHLALLPQELAERRNAFVANVKGLEVDRFPLTFKDVRGIDRARWFGTRLCEGPESPSVILRIDELDKKMGGGSGQETHGATQGDELNVLLTEMEDNGWSGVLAYGHPGTGKTLWTRTLGPTCNVPTLVLDLGGTRSKFVGESEQNVRAAMKTVKAIGGDRVYVMATCNELDTLKPELKRRFTDGVFFFDLPSDEELIELFDLYRASYQVSGTLDISYVGWTGAEVRNACRLAHRLQVPLTEAAQEIIPVSKADPESVARRRRRAHQRFRNAALPGPYVMGTEPHGAVRQFAEVAE